MNRRSLCTILVLLGLLLFPFTSPAPLIYRPGEGWTYEMPGSNGSWHRERAKDQLDFAQKAFDQKNYGLALKSAKRVVSVWPLSDFAPQSQYLVGRCYEARKQDEKAFNAYQEILEKYPKIPNYKEIQQRQFDIATRFLAGQWFKLFGYIPVFPSMEKTSTMFDKIVKSGPYSDVAPKAQLNIGAAREKQKDYPAAVKAYETAADRYNEQRQIASDALYKAGMAYNKQAKTAEYDQNVASQAISTFNDFITLYPADPRIPAAQRLIITLKAEQARSNFKIAKFYEKHKRWDGALIYYNEVLLKDAGSPWPPKPANASTPSNSARNNMRQILLALAASLLIVGCAGYHLGPLSGEPAGARSVQFRPFVNRTLEPRISEYVNLEMRKQIQRDGTFRLETEDYGDIIVSGEIVKFDRGELSFSATDVLTPQDYNLTLTARILAIDRSTGKTNLNRLVTGRTAIRIGNDLSNTERQAMPILAEDLAHNAISALADAPW